MNYEEWFAIRGDLMEPCALCGELGMPDDEEEPGDEDHAPILSRYRDGACRLDGELVCTDCEFELDNRMNAMEREQSMRYGHARR